MAGVGFELRKMFKQESIHSKIKGVVYATMTTVGPTILFMLLLLGIRFLLSALKVSQLEQTFFSASCLYLFVIANVISGALNTISTRFISDMIFENKDDYIPATMYGTIIIGSSVTALIELPICILLYIQYGISPIYLVGYYFFGIMITVTYCITTYISAVKEYAKITEAYFIGLLCSVGIFYILHLFTRVSTINNVIFSLALGFVIINTLLIYYILSFFKTSNNQFFAFTAYYKKFPMLFYSGIFYVIGLYIPNIIYWFWSEISVKIDLFHVAPAYDMATFLAVVINLSATVIFTVKVETEFYEKYKIYVTAINAANYASIEKAKSNMVSTIVLNLFFVYEIQLIITVILMCLGILVFPLIGIGGMQEDFFLLLGIAYYATFSMYYTIIFLYYFMDQLGAFIATGIFLSISIVTAIVALRLGSEYYAIAPFAGAVFAWIYAFLRLKYILKDLTANIFCNVLK